MKIATKYNKLESQHDKLESRHNKLESQHDQLESQHDHLNRKVADELKWTKRETTVAIIILLTLYGLQIYFVTLNTDTEYKVYNVLSLCVLGIQLIITIGFHFRKYIKLAWLHIADGEQTALMNSDEPPINNSNV